MTKGRTKTKMTMMAMKKRVGGDADCNIIAVHKSNQPSRTASGWDNLSFD